MTVPSGLTDDRSTAGLDAAATSWNTKGTPFTSAIDPVAAALMNAKLPDGQLSDSLGAIHGCLSYTAYRT